MTIRSKWSLAFRQKALNTKDSFDTILPTVEVVTNSKTVIYSVRVLIIAIALIMGYMQTRNRTNEPTGKDRKEYAEQATPGLFKK